MRKPKNTKINLLLLTQKQLEYYCSSIEIDRVVFPAVGHEFNEDLAKEIASHKPFYFVVKTNGEHDVIAGGRFDAWIASKSKREASREPLIKKGEVLTDLAKDCIDHFAASLIEQHKKFAKKLNKDIKASFGDFKRN